MEVPDDEVERLLKEKRLVYESLARAQKRCTELACEVRELRAELESAKNMIMLLLKGEVNGTEKPSQNQ